jgi:virginiamycin A acetyltransferase
MSSNTICSTSTVYKDCDIRGSFLGEQSTIGDHSVVIESRIENNVQINRRNFIQNSTISSFTYTGQDTLVRGADIGKFCSISWLVSIGGKNHKVDNTSSMTLWAYHNLKRDKLKGSFDYRLGSNDCLIGNDVWIGSHSVVLRNLEVGHGAVIGAGSVVTRDVMPYEIVAGVPAKRIRFRFAPDQIEELLNISWWDWPTEMIERHKTSLFGSKLDIDNILKIKGGFSP